MYSGSSEASSGEKTFEKSKYLLGIEVKASFATNAAICALREGLTSSSWVLLGLSRETIWTTKISYPGSRAGAANSFFPISLAHLVVGKASSKVYDLYQSSLFRKLTSALFRVKNGILRIISRLIFAIRKVSSKNLTLMAWSVTEKAATTIS